MVISRIKMGSELSELTKNVDLTKKNERFINKLVTSWNEMDINGLSPTKLLLNPQKLG